MEVFQRVNTENKAEERVCRICLEVETESKGLICPCKCSGSIKYVHEGCLKSWIISSKKDIQGCCCDLCKEQFEMEIVFKRSCACGNINEECFKIFLVPLVIVLIASILAVVLFYLIQSIKNHTLNSETIVYFVLVTTACGLVQATLIYILVKSVIKGCTVMEVKEWSIKSVRSENRLDETFEVTHATELTHREEEQKENKVKSREIKRCEVKIKGRNVVVPEIRVREMIRNEENRKESFGRTPPRSEYATPRLESISENEDQAPLSSNRKGYE
jgi:hypothetical protein